MKKAIITFVIMALLIDSGLAMAQEKGGGQALQPQAQSQPAPMMGQGMMMPPPMMQQQQSR